MSTNGDDDLAARTRAIPGAGRQAIEGNPLTVEEVEMFEMFRRERWSPEQRRAYILALCKPASGTVR